METAKLVIIIILVKMKSDEFEYWVSRTFPFRYTNRVCVLCSISLHRILHSGHLNFSLRNFVETNTVSLKSAAIFPSHFRDFVWRERKKKNNWKMEEKKNGRRRCQFRSTLIFDAKSSNSRHRSSSGSMQRQKQHFIFIFDNLYSCLSEGARNFAILRRR